MTDGGSSLPVAATTHREGAAGLGPPGVDHRPWRFDGAAASGRRTELRFHAPVRFPASGETLANLRKEKRHFL